MRRSALVVGLATLTAVVACGDEPTNRGDFVVHIDGEARRTVRVCADGSSKLGTTFVVSNPMDRSISLSLIEVGAANPVLGIMRLRPQFFTLAPHQARSVTMEIAGIPDNHELGHRIQIFDQEIGGTFHDLSFGIDFVLDDRMIELSLAQPSQDGSPRVLIHNPTPIPADLALFSEGKWQPYTSKAHVGAHESVAIPMFESDAAPLPTGNAATFSVRGSRCSSRPLPEAALVIHRGEAVGK